MVIVGEEKEEFFVHAYLLKSTSKYFEKLLNVEPGVQKQNAERTFRTVKLLDMDTNAFKLFSKWLYTGYFHFPGATTTQATNGLHSKSLWDKLVSCYGMSVLIQASSFADATIDAFITQMKISNTSPVDLAKWIYPRTLKGSVHRILCRDIVVHTWDRSQFSLLWKEDFPRDFIDSVLEEVGSNLDSGVKRKSVVEFLASKGPCTYHEHVRLNVPCYNVKFGG